jgi:hypothetical protein
MIAKLGSRIKVSYFRSAGDRQNRTDPVICMAVVTSDGPPGVQAVWARTTDQHPQWLLVRKSLSKPDTDYDSIAGDQGKFD